MKRILSSLLAGAVLLSMSACAGGGNSSETPSSEDRSSSESASAPDSSETSGNSESEPSDALDSASSEPDYSALSEEEIYRLMVERSLMTTGDMTRMANVLKKAENGEEITIAYIGGSITEGMTVTPAHPELCWAYLSYEWLCEKYPAAKINYVNAGLSGTPSILGNARLERDVLAQNADICFVEFAVNDGGTAEYKNSYESLVRTLLTQDKDIAVVLLFTVIESGHTCQPHMSQIGNNYALPMISEPDSLGVEFAKGRMTWQDYSDDQSHPNEYGHTVVRDFVTNYFEKVMETVDANVGAVDKTLPAPVFSDRFENMHFIDSEKLNAELVGFQEYNVHNAFQNGWMFRGSDDASMKFTLNCKSLELIYKANNNDLYADADIYVDGERVRTVSSNQGDGWNNPVTSLVIDNDESAEHTVEIKVSGGENHYFAVLGFGYCD